MKEIWKKIDFNKRYEISNFGRIRSLYEYNANKKIYILRGKPLILKTSYDKGYEKIILKENNKRRVKYIHRLVAEAFIPNPNNYKEINHKDSNSINNSVDNLEWCTRKYNLDYMAKHQQAIKENHEMRLETLEDIYYGIELGYIKTLEDVKNRIDVNLLEEY